MIRATVQTPMITTADICGETGLDQRTIQKRIVRLGISVRRVGGVIVLTSGQADKIKAMESKPGPKSRAARAKKNGKIQL